MPLCDSHTLQNTDQTWISLSNDAGQGVPQLPKVPELAPIRFSRMNFSEVYTGWRGEKQKIDERAEEEQETLLEHREKSLRSLQSMDSFSTSSDSLNSSESFDLTEDELSLNSLSTGTHTLRKARSTAFEKTTEKLFEKDKPELHWWELSEDDYNAYKTTALKKIKNRKRQELQKHKHRPPKIVIPKSPQKLQLISPQTPTLASAPPIQPPPRRPPPTVADYARMRSSHYREGEIKSPLSLSASSTSVSSEHDTDSFTDTETHDMKAFREVWEGKRGDLGDVAVETPTGRGPGPGLGASPNPGPERATPLGADLTPAHLEKTTIAPAMEETSPNPRPDSAIDPNPRPDVAVNPNPTWAAPGLGPNPELNEEVNPNPGPNSARVGVADATPPDSASVAATGLGGIVDATPPQSSSSGNNSTRSPEPADNAKTTDIPLSSLTRDITDDTYVTHDTYFEYDEDDATDIQDMNGHPRRVSSLSSTNSGRSIEGGTREVSREGSRDKPSRDTRELSQLSSITKGLVKNSPFFDLDENRKSGPRASGVNKGRTEKSVKDVASTSTGDDVHFNTIDAAINSHNSMHETVQQRGSSLRAGRSLADSSTDSVDSFKSTKEIPREFAPDSPPSTSQISTPKKDKTREPKDDTDQEDFSFVDHSDSVKRSTHKPWDKDDPKMRRSILAEFENDLNDLLLLSNKSPEEELDFGLPKETNDEQDEPAYSEPTIRVVEPSPVETTHIESAPVDVEPPSSADTLPPVPTPDTNAEEHASDTPDIPSTHDLSTSPTSPIYVDAPPPPPADPMPTTPGEALDSDTITPRKKAPSIASTSTATTINAVSANPNKRGLRSVSSSASLKLRTSIFPFKGPQSAGGMSVTTPETASMTGSMYSSSIYSGSTLVRDSPAVTVAKTRMKTSLKSFPILYYAVTLSGPVNVKYNIEGATPAGQYGILSLPTAPHPWEKPPEDLALRGVWFLRLVVDSGTNTAGGFLTDKLFVPRDVWSLSSSMSSKVLDKRLYITDEYCRAICEFMAFADANGYSPRQGEAAPKVSSTAQSIDDALERLDARIENLSRHQYVMKSDGDLIVDLGAHSPDSDDTLTPLATSVPPDTIHPVMSHPTPSTTPMTSNNRRSSDIGLLANHIFSKKEEKPKEPKEDKDNSSSKLFKRFQRKISLANNHSSENLSLPSEKTNGKTEGPAPTPVDPHHDYGARYFNAISALYSDMEALAHYRFLLQNEARDSQAARGYSQAVIIEAIDSCFGFSNTICRIILQDILSMLEVYLEGGKSVLAE